MSLSTFLILLVIGALGVMIGHALAVKGKTQKYHRLQEEAKQKQKQVIREFLRTHSSITNDQVQELTGVSDATATRYLDELEEEGVVEQRGEGRGTHYEKTA